MKMQLARIAGFVGLFVCLSFVGCVSTGTNFDESKVSQIRKGETTEADLVRMFGKPNNRTTQMTDGKTSTVLTWAFVKSNAFGGPLMSTDVKMKTLGVFLDASGKVERVTYTGDIPSGN